MYDRPLKASGQGIMWETHPNAMSTAHAEHRYQLLPSEHQYTNFKALILLCTPLNAVHCTQLLNIPREFSTFNTLNQASLRGSFYVVVYM